MKDTIAMAAMWRTRWRNRRSIYIPRREVEKDILQLLLEPEAYYVRHIARDTDAQRYYREAYAEFSQPTQYELDLGEP